MDIYEFLDWFNSRNPDYRIYNDDLDLVSCDYSSKTLARFSMNLEVSESEAKRLEQRLLDALHKQETDALSGNIDFDGYIADGLLDYLIQHINDLDNETILKLIDVLYRKSRWGSNKIFSLTDTPGLPRVAIDKLKSLGFGLSLALHNPDLSGEERTEIIISDVKGLLECTSPVSQLGYIMYNKYVSDDVLRYIVLNSKQPKVRALVARRDNLSPDIVDMLKNDKSIVVRREVDKNYN